MVVEVTPLDGLPLLLLFSALPPVEEWREGWEGREGGRGLSGAFKGYYGGVERCHSVLGRGSGVLEGVREVSEGVEVLGCKTVLEGAVGIAGSWRLLLKL